MSSKVRARSCGCSVPLFALRCASLPNTKQPCTKFNWLKDKLPCLDSSASPADQAHHAVRAVRVKICVKTSCPVLDRPTGKQRPEVFYRVNINSGHLLVAWQADRLLIIKL